jgi:hypothetical protein
VNEPVHPDHAPAGSAGGVLGERAGPGGTRPRAWMGQAGRFIWQLVGVLDTYGSICLIGTKV